MTAQGSPQCLRDLGTPLPLRLPLGQDPLVLGVQLRHVAGHAVSDIRQGLGTQHQHQSCPQSSSPTRTPHLPSFYLRLSWPLADGPKKRAGSRDGDIGPKCMARGCGGLLTVGDMGPKGVGDVYPAVWRGREKHLGDRGSQRGLSDLSLTRATSLHRGDT